MTTHVDPDLVKDVRARSGLTSREFGLCLGVGPGAVHGWENGLRFLDSHRARILELLEAVVEVETVLPAGIPQQTRVNLVYSALTELGGKVDEMRRARADHPAVRRASIWRTFTAGSGA